MSTCSDRYLIRNARIVKPTRIVDGDIILENGVISYIGKRLDETDHFEVVDAAGHYVVPGFVDIHCHGGGGFDLTSGRYDTKKECFDEDTAQYQDSLEELMGIMAGNGTTRVMLSTIAAPMERLEVVLSELAKYVDGDRNAQSGADLCGAFIEGTFVRFPEFAGAQNPEYFSEPNTEVFERLNSAASGHIRYVNVVPEYGDSALELTEYLTELGVLVGAGHCSCPAEMYDQAIKKGLRIAVHFTNGPTGSSFKPFGGGSVLQSVLTSNKVYAELIADGYHINPAYVMDILHRKGVNRVVAITDGFFPAGAKDIGEFVAAGIKGRVSDNGEYLEVVEKDNTLFGSVLNMRVAFSNWVSWLTRPMRGIWVDEHLPLETDEAVLMASRLCSINPAKVMGILEPVSRHLGEKLEDYVGSLEVGKRADVVILKLNGTEGEYKAEVNSVFVKGKHVVG